MTNYEKITESVETLAEHLVEYVDEYGEYFTSNCERFENREDAILEEIKWLNQPYDESEDNL